jgi:hypothetical protein
MDIQESSLSAYFEVDHSSQSGVKLYLYASYRSSSYGTLGTETTFTYFWKENDERMSSDRNPTKFYYIIPETTYLEKNYIREGNIHFFTPVTGQYLYYLIQIKVDMCYTWMVKVKLLCLTKYHAIKHIHWLIKHHAMKDILGEWRYSSMHF